jgi:hypothetical protein
MMIVPECHYAPCCLPDRRFSGGFPFLCSQEHVGIVAKIGSMPA